MHAVFGFPALARFSWANTKHLLDNSDGIAPVDW